MGRFIGSLDVGQAAYDASVASQALDPIVLRKIPEGSADPSDLGGDRRQAPIPHTGLGLLSSNLDTAAGTLLPETTAIVILLRASISVAPEVSDEIVHEGISYVVLTAGLDPKEAIWSIQAAKI